MERCKLSEPCMWKFPDPDKAISVEWIKTRKALIEEEIRQRICRFEKEFDVRVDSIEIDRLNSVSFDDAPAYSSVITKVDVVVRV